MNKPITKMSDDELLRALAQVKRSQQAASGEAGSADSATQLSDSTRERIVTAVLEALPDQPPTKAAGAPPEQVVPSSRKSSFLGRAFRWPQVMTWATPALAVGALVLMLRPSNPEPLPRYQLSFAGHESQHRSASGSATPKAPLNLGPETKLRLLLKPETAVDGELSVKSYLVMQGQAAPWDSAVEKAPSGAVRLELDALPPESTGEATLYLWIGRPDALEGSFDELVSLPNSGQFQRWTQALKVTR